MENLRWILLLAGIAVVLVVYLVSYYQGRRKQPPAPRNKLRSQPLLSETDAVTADVDLTGAIDDELEQLGQIISADKPAVEAVSVVDMPAEKREPAAVADQVFMLFVEAPKGVPFRGPILLGALAAAQLEFGDMDIFHRVEQDSGQEKVLFSVANIREPGTFDLSAMESFTSEGVVLFMQVPGAADAVRAFDMMVESSGVLAENLDSRVCDATHNQLTRQAISHMREEVISCQLQQRVANAAS
ncbi:MAG: cell division protein ZipA [Gammaproteobacteria bacterium]|nr:cell division protein ZipA [Gammaproteobacteria bacterium]